ncbi:hypothetical protein GCM10023094_33410 [Rhodococcus olei]|uniref:Uncharacterized protein n=2 Tax=Rhodococcus olei TaxID=2161675 RepID=A0ABP8P7P5_9NOCA
MRAHEIETHALNVRGTSNDFREGLAAFFDKRDPEFVDRVSSDRPDVFADLPAGATSSRSPPGDRIERRRVTRSRADGDRRDTHETANARRTFRGAARVRDQSRITCRSREASART